MNEQFTTDGRRILEEKTVGGELQQLVEMATLPAAWVCTCGMAACSHIQQIVKPKTVSRIRSALNRICSAALAYSKKICR